MTVALPAGYGTYMLVSNVVPASAVSDILCAQIGTDTTAANYFIAGNAWAFSNGAIQFGTFSSAAGLVVGTAQGQSTAMIYVTGKSTSCQGVGGGGLGTFNGGAIYAGSQAIAGNNIVLQIAKTSGNAGDIVGDNIASGSSFKLYGLQ